MNIWLQLAALPLVGALIGWLTNWLAIKMLFRPRRAVGVAGLKVQGLLPKRRRELAVNIGEVVERELISHEDVKRRLTDPAFLESVRRTCDKHVELFVKERIYSIVPSMLSNVVPLEPLAKKVKDIVVEEIVKILPGLIEGFTKDLESRLEFKKIITEKVEGFELEKLEGIVMRIAKSELRYIEIFGGVLGFLIGLAQFAVIAFTR